MQWHGNFFASSSIVFEPLPKSQLQTHQPLAEGKKLMEAYPAYSKA